MTSNDHRTPVAIQPPAERTVTLPFTLVACLSPHDELLLVLRRSKPPFVGSWNFLGGKIEYGESAQRSAQRELAEEAGICVNEDALRYKGIAMLPNWQDGADFIGMHLFCVRLRPGKLDSHQTSLADEGVIAWLPIDTLLSGTELRAVPNLPAFLSVFRDRSRIPSVLAYARSDDDTYKNSVTKLSAPQRLLHKSECGQITLPLSALTQTASDLSDVTGVLLA